MIHSDLWKRFKGNKINALEQYEVDKQNFIIFGPPNSGKTALIEDLCCLYETVHVICSNTREWN